MTLHIVFYYQITMNVTIIMASAVITVSTMLDPTIVSVMAATSWPRMGIDATVNKLFVFQAYLFS